MFTSSGRGLRPGQRLRGSRNPYKPGLKIDFGRYVDQKFLGLKSPVLANGWQDPSLMKQRISMLFYNRMGIPAPRVMHARVFINDEYVGLYQVMEPLDKNFLARVYGTDEAGKRLNGGYLYEHLWKDAYEWDYLGSSLQTYLELFEPKTHEDEAPSVLDGPFETLFKTVNEVSAGALEREAGLADPQKCFCNERMDDELQKVLRFAREQGPYVLREAGKARGWPETDGRQAATTRNSTPWAINEPKNSRKSGASSTMLPPQELHRREAFFRRPTPPVFARRVAPGVLRGGHDANRALQPEFHVATMPG